MWGGSGTVLQTAILHMRGSVFFRLSHASPFLNDLNLSSLPNPLHQTTSSVPSSATTSIGVAVVAWGFFGSIRMFFFVLSRLPEFSLVDEASVLSSDLSSMEFDFYDINTHRLAACHRFKVPGVTGRFIIPMDTCCLYYQWIRDVHATLREEMQFDRTENTTDNTPQKTATTRIAATGAPA